MLVSRLMLLMLESNVEKFEVVSSCVTLPPPPGNVLPVVLVRLVSAEEVLPPI